MADPEHVQIGTQNITLLVKDTTGDENERYKRVRNQFNVLFKCSTRITLPGVNNFGTTFLVAEQQKYVKEMHEQTICRFSCY